MPYYAIARGIETGIFNSSEEYNKYKIGQYSCGKKCKTKDEATMYIKSINKILNHEYFAFIDLEFTCSRTINDFKYKNHIGEVLSIGLIITNNKGEQIDSFYKTVKPKYNNKMSDFCKELTHLNQNDIDNSSNLMIVLNSLKKIISKYKITRIYCFGTTDYAQTKRDIENYKGHALYDIGIKLVNKFYNCQNEISKRLINEKNNLSLYDCKQLLNIDGMVKHNALSDAKDLSNVYFSSIYSPPSKKNISKYKEIRHYNIIYRQLRRIHTEKLDLNENDINEIKKVCNILGQKNVDDNIKIKVLIDDLLQLINQEVIT